MKPKFQSYPDGLVNIYRVDNIGAPGDMPVEGLVFKNSLRYKERTVGIARRYAAMQNNKEVNYVIRCPELRTIEANDVAIIAGGKQYEITWVQYIEDARPPSMDLTLERLGENSYAIG